MTSSKLTKTSNRPLLLLSAAFPLQTGGGTSPAALDPQEQARRVILGTHSADSEAEVVAPRYAQSTSSAGAHSDAQEMARRMILGTVI